MDIIITPTETDLIQAFRDRNIKYSTENLLVGDAHVRYDGVTIYIFERKAKNDLDASIKDGRYAEQKSRLLQTNLPTKNIIYVIENLPKMRDQSTYTRVWSAMCNSQHRDGFTVFQTKTTDETAQYISSIGQSVQKFGPKLHLLVPSTVSPSPADTPMSLSSPSPQIAVAAATTPAAAAGDPKVFINIKKNHVTSENIFKYILTLIPRCSESVADAIISMYPTMTVLLDAFKKHGEYCLADLKHGACQRRIGTKLSQQISQTLSTL